jgi:hypothetical protein
VNLSKPFLVHIIFVFSSFFPAGKAFCDPFAGLDISVASGLVAGRISSTNADGTTRQFRIGGVPFAVMLNRDLSGKFTGSLQTQLLLDVVNQQMVRQGFSGILSYHVFGGARQIAVPGDMVHTVSTSPYNLSLSVRGGLFSYAAADRKDPKTKLSGSVWEMAGGIEYRRTVTPTSAIGASFLGTVLTLPSSVERLSTRTFELLGFWRMYL